MGEDGGGNGKTGSGDGGGEEKSTLSPGEG